MIAGDIKTEIMFHFQNNFHFDKNVVRYFLYAIYVALLFIQLFGKDKSKSMYFTKVCIIPFVDIKSDL